MLFRVPPLPVLRSAALLRQHLAELIKSHISDLDGLPTLIKELAVDEGFEIGATPSHGGPSQVSGGPGAATGSRVEHVTEAWHGVCLDSSPLIKLYESANLCE